MCMSKMCMSWLKCACREWFLLEVVSVNVHVHAQRIVHAHCTCIFHLSLISSTISLFTRLFTSPILVWYLTLFSTLRAHWSISSQHNSSGASSLWQDLHVGGRFPFREKTTISHDMLQLQIQEKAFAPWEDQDFEPAEYTNPRCEVKICLLVCL